MNIHRSLEKETKRKQNKCPQEDSSTRVVSCLLPRDIQKEQELHQAIANYSARLSLCFLLFLSFLLTFTFTAVSFMMLLSREKVRYHFLADNYNDIFLFTLSYQALFTRQTIVKSHSHSLFLSHTHTLTQTREPGKKRYKDT